MSAHGEPTRFDAVVTGVGGQGVLTLTRILAEAALREGWTVKQGEIHGMSQREGAVRATLRIARGPLFGDQVPRGGAALLVGLEPVEALRNLPFLSPAGRLVTSTAAFVNVPDYPEPRAWEEALSRIPGAVTLDAGALAREAGSARAQNVVVLGAASPFLPLRVTTLRDVVRDAVRPLGDRLVEINARAFEAGRERAAGPAGSARG